MTNPRFARVALLTGIVFVAVLGVTAGTADAQNAAGPPHPRLVDAKPVRVSLRQDIEITLDDPDSKWTQTDEAKGLVLYVNGYQLKGAAPRWGGEGSNRVSFSLMRDAASQKEWAVLLGRPSFAARRVRVQVGLEGQPPFSGASTLELMTLDQMWFWIFLVFVIVLLGFFIALARRSDVLREGPVAPAAPARRPFSLGRTQMAAWFFIVLASFVFIWMVTGAYDPLTPSVLALIGISAGTAMSAAIIDANKRGALDNKSAAVNDERQRLETDITALKSTIQQTQATIAAPPVGVDVTTLQQQLIKNQAEIAAKEARIAQVDLESRTVIATAVQPRASEGFLNDVLSDENGVGFHRFQIVVWTVVLGIIFVYTVYDSLAMPDFDAKLLGLMGISAGTYLGFKFPESL